MLLLTFCLAQGAGAAPYRSAVTPDGERSNGRAWSLGRSPALAVSPLPTPRRGGPGC